MVDRIKRIMEIEGLASSAFADKLNVGRAVISHILNGRNNPSLDLVLRILETFDQIDADWLLSGSGPMLKENMTAQEHKREASIPDLFAPSVDKSTENMPSTTAYVRQQNAQQEMAPNSPNANTESTKGHSQPIMQIEKEVVTNRKITKIIIYYSDNTFEVFDGKESNL